MPEIPVVVPAYRERENVSRLPVALERNLGGLDREAIFVVDDAANDTEELVRERAQQDRRVRCIQRIGRCGLVSACVEGMLSSSAPYDPMSGFLGGTQDLSRTGGAQALRPRGFKSLLDMIAGARGDARIAELPYRMRSRARGESKLGARVVAEFFTLILYHLTSRLLPARFFCSAQSVSRASECNSPFYGWRSGSRESSCSARWWRLGRR